MPEGPDSKVFADKFIVKVGNYPIISIDSYHVWPESRIRLTGIQCMTKIYLHYKISLKLKKIHVVARQVSLHRYIS